jgi:hypothetical protein
LFDEFELELLDELELELFDEFELELLDELELVLFDEFELELLDELELVLFDEFELELSDDSVDDALGEPDAACGETTAGDAAAAGSLVATTTLHQTCPCPYAMPTPIHW